MTERDPEGRGRPPRALVVGGMPGARAVVGGLPLVVRAILALRAAGCADVAVLAGSERREIDAILARRGVPVRWLSGPDDPWGAAGPDAVLVLSGDVLVDARGVARAPRCRASAVPGLLADLGAGRPPAAARARAGIPEAPRPGKGLFVPLDERHPPSVLETRLLDSFAPHTAAADSYMAALVDRRLSRPVTRLLVNWPLSPSRVTLLSLAVGLVGAAGLATTAYLGRLMGVLLLLASSVLDCVDGEVARARFEQSAAGARLDVIGDYAVHLAVFAGLGVGLVRAGLPAGGAWPALALVGGVAAAMLAMHALFVRPALFRAGDLHWPGDGEGLKGTPVAAVAEKLASRDYTYLLLVLALADRLDWFLYAAAAGSWLFAAGVVAYWALGPAGRRHLPHLR